MACYSPNASDSPLPHGPRAPCEEAATYLPVHRLCPPQPWYSVGAGLPMELWNAGNRSSTVMVGQPSLSGSPVPCWLQKGSIGPGAADVDRNEVHRAQGVGSSVVTS